MVIRVQNEEAIYDVNKLLSIFASNDGKVYGLNYDGELAYELGDYSSKERAVEIVEEIYSIFDGQTRYDMPVI